MKLKKLSLLLTLLISLGSVNDAIAKTSIKKQRELAYSYHRQGNYHQAFKQFQKLAKQGDSESQGILGNLYLLGEGVEMNLPEAFKWHSKAAAQGEADSQAVLGHMYHFGRYVKRDGKKAKMWLTKSCKNGRKESCDFLSMNY